MQTFEGDIDSAISYFTEQLFELRGISTLHKDTMQEMTPALSVEQKALFDDMPIRQQMHTLITISTLDLLAILKLYTSVEILWCRMFLLSKSYLTIHETIKCYEAYIKELRQLVIADGDTVDMFNEINLDLRKFKKDFNEKRIIEIRNIVGGHIHKDLDQYHETLLSIDPKEAINTLHAILDIFFKINKFLSALRNSINKKLEIKRAELQVEVNSKIQELKDKLKGLLENNSQ